eukprot:scaffold96655_cov35-Phaeocystis_antarctica.AAC.2
MGEGALGLLGAVVVPSEEGEQGRDEEDEASYSSHRACVVRPAAATTAQVWGGGASADNKRVEKVGTVAVPAQCPCTCTPEKFRSAAPQGGRFSAWR